MLIMNMLAMIVIITFKALVTECGIYYKKAPWLFWDNTPSNVYFKVLVSKWQILTFTFIHHNTYIFSNKFHPPFSGRRESGRPSSRHNVTPAAFSSWRVLSPTNLEPGTFWDPILRKGALGRGWNRGRPGWGAPRPGPDQSRFPGTARPWSGTRGCCQRCNRFWKQGRIREIKYIYNFFSTHAWKN